jgi:hypothetical protein
MPRVMVGALAVLLSGCASIGGLLPGSRDRSAAPNLSGSIVLMRSGEWGFGLAHGCMVSEDMVLTARHVALHYDGRIELPLSYSIEIGGQRGVVRLERSYDDLDLAVMRVYGAAIPQSFYKMAGKPLAEGDTVWVRDFDRDEKMAMKPKDVEATIKTILPQHAILSGWAQPGASGGCVLNSDGDLVGIYTAIIFLADGKSSNSKVTPMGVIVTIPSAFEVPVASDVKLGF